MPRARAAANAIRVRPVQGRQLDPFRGSLDDSPKRLASRDADTQPFADVLAAIEAIALVRVERAGRRLGLRRNDERLKVAFVSGARRVGLEDIVLEGDGRLAIAVMHALVPWFGPVEIQIGRYDDLIDGHDTAQALIDRYDTWFVDDAVRLARELGAVEPPLGRAPGAAAPGAAAPTVGAGIQSRRVVPSNRRAAIIVLIVTAVLGVLAAVLLPR